MLRCVDCARVSDTGHGWVAYIVEDLDGEDETTVATYCPECAEREFDWEPPAGRGELSAD